MSILMVAPLTKVKTANGDTNGISSRFNYKFLGEETKIPSFFSFIDSYEKFTSIDNNALGGAYKDSAIAAIKKIVSEREAYTALETSAGTVVAMNDLYESIKQGISAITDEIKNKGQTKFTSGAQSYDVWLDYNITNPKYLKPKDKEIEYYVIKVEGDKKCSVLEELFEGVKKAKENIKPYVSSTMDAELKKFHETLNKFQVMSLPDFYKHVGASFKTSGNRNFYESIGPSVEEEGQPFFDGAYADNYTTGSRSNCNAFKSWVHSFADCDGCKAYYGCFSDPVVGVKGSTDEYAEYNMIFGAGVKLSEFTSTLNNLHSALKVHEYHTIGREEDLYLVFDYSFQDRFWTIYAPVEMCNGTQGYTFKNTYLQKWVNIFNEQRQHRKRFMQKCDDTKFYIIPNSATFNDLTVKVSQERKKVREAEALSIKNKILPYFKATFGFEPTLNKFVEMLFAHVDFFMTQSLKGIYETCIRDKANRFLQGNHTLITDYKSNEKFLPPFVLTAIRDKVDETMVKKYPGEISFIKNKMKEVGYIDNFVDKIVLKATEVEQINATQQEIEFTRVLPSDVLLNNNPYFISTAKVKKTLVVDVVMNHIYTVLAMRAFNAQIYGNMSKLNGFLSADAVNIKHFLKYIPVSNLYDKVYDISHVEEKFSKLVNGDCNYFGIKYDETTYNAVSQMTNEELYINAFNGGKKNNKYGIIGKRTTGDNKESYCNMILYKQSKGEEGNQFLESYIRKGDGVAPKNISVNNAGKKRYDNYNEVTGTILSDDDKWCLLGVDILIGDKDNVKIKEEFFQTTNGGKIFVGNKKEMIDEKDDDGKDIKKDSGQTYSIYKTKLYWILLIGAAIWYNKKRTDNLNAAIYENGNDIYRFDHTTCEFSMCEEIFKKWATAADSQYVDLWEDIKVHGLRWYYSSVTIGTGNVPTGSKDGVQPEAPDFNPFNYSVYLIILEENTTASSDFGNFVDIASGENGVKKIITELRAENQNAMQNNNAEALREQKEWQKTLKSNMYYETKNIGDKYMHEVCSGRFTKDAVGSVCDSRKITIVDSFMKDITESSYVDVMVIFELLKESIQNTPSMSALQFLAKMAERSKYLFFTMPTNIFRDNNGEWVKDVFGLNPWGKFNSNHDIDNHFMFIRQNEDSFNIGGEYYEPDNVVDDHFGGHIGVNTFDVKYGEQKNNIFKGISMNMQDSINTEESIANTLMISKGNATNGNVTDVSKTVMNLFDIYKSRSYKVSIEAMGAPNITPLMFFNLQNVPIYSGIYRIIKVGHRISPNDFTTSIVGVKVGKYVIPEDRLSSAFFNMVNLLAGSVKRMGNDEDVEGKVATISADCNDDVDKTLKDVLEIASTEGYDYAGDKYGIRKVYIDGTEKNTYYVKHPFDGDSLIIPESYRKGEQDVVKKMVDEMLTPDNNKTKLKLGKGVNLKGCKIEIVSILYNIWNESQKIKIKGNPITINVIDAFSGRVGNYSYHPRKLAIDLIGTCQGQTQFLVNRYIFAIACKYIKDIGYIIWENWTSKSGPGVGNGSIDLTSPMYPECVHIDTGHAEKKGKRKVWNKISYGIVTYSSKEKRNITKTKGLPVGCVITKFREVVKNQTSPYETIFNPMSYSSVPNMIS
jgi:hypothetical protein